MDEPSTSRKVKFQCDICQQTFDREFRYAKHKLKNCNKVSCEDCKKKFHSRRELDRHRRSSEKLGCGIHCGRVFCTRYQFEKHQREIKPVTVTCEDDCVNEVIQPTLFEGVERYVIEKRQHYDKIKDFISEYKHYTLMNKEIPSDFTYGDLRKLLYDIAEKQDSVTKWNIGFGFILYNYIEDKFKYFYPSSNNLLFENAFQVSNNQDLVNFYKKIIGLDLVNNYYLRKPSSSWVMAGLVNVSIYIYPIKDVPIGTAIELPDYLINSKAIHALVKDYSTCHLFTDNKCMFRCLALHNEAEIYALERTTNHLLDEIEQTIGISFEDGVSLSDLPVLEEHFRVSINVYSLRENGEADVIRLSKLTYPTLHVNLYNKHFSYIKDFTKYARKYVCQTCKRIFNTHRNLKRHAQDCTIEVKEYFKGGKYLRKKTIFEELKTINIVVPDGLQFCPWFSVFDFESIQIMEDRKINGRTIISRHEPATFSTCSNIPGHTNPVHVRSYGDIQKLVDEFITENLKQQATFSKLMRERYAPYLQDLIDQITEIEAEMECIEKPNRKRKLNEFSTVEEKETYVKQRKLIKLRALLSKFDYYCDQIVILGFNSQNYDVPLIKNYLPSSLSRLDTLPRFVIKKDGGYMVIASNRLKYLDLMNYLAAGTSLEKLYKAYGVSNPKGTFPYEWFSSLDKLDFEGLPPKSFFYSTLTDDDISEETFKNCEALWEEQNMETFSDYVRYYNNNDVTGLVEVINQMISIYNQRGLDPFKTSVSLPGLTQQYLFQSLKRNEYFVNIGEEHKDLYKLFKTSICGGPSLIFTRYHEKGLTKIRNGSKTCRKIIGFDANSLYLWCLAQLMPTEHYSRRRKPNFIRETRCSEESLQWLAWIGKSTGVNLSREEKIDDYYVDALDKTNRVIYEYYGCYFHGHHCNTRYDPEMWKKTMEREQHLRDLQYKVVSITSCEWHKMEESKIWYQPQESDRCTMEDILESVKNDELFGFVRCDLHVPDHLIDRFSDFPPIFKNTEITLADIGDHMQEYCRSVTRKTGVKRGLIGSMHGKDILLLTPLLKEYLRLGLVVTNVEEVIQFNGKSVFSWFMDEVIDNRRLADLDPAYIVRGDTSKLMGNSGYGRTILDVYKHTNTTFVEDENVPKHIANPFFKTMEELNNGVYEVEKKKKAVVLDLPIQIGVAVYNYAKLKMIQFWDFLDTYLMKSHFELMQMDTDSLYIAIAADSIDDCVKEEKKQQWIEVRKKFFPSDDQEIINFNGHQITKGQYSLREPGLFKVEFTGDGMVCLNSKVYIAFGDQKTKVSCKGIQQRRNDLVKEQFLDVLKTQKPKYFDNAGFIKNTDEAGPSILTYVQNKKGLGYFYAKRKILDDGISTTHLDI